MLSQDLRMLHVWFCEVLERRAEFTVEGACHFAGCLEQAVKDAEALEDQPVPPAKRAVGAVAGGNVVPFRRGPRPPLRPVPGGAA